MKDLNSQSLRRTYLVGLGAVFTMAVVTGCSSAPSASPTRAESVVRTDAEARPKAPPLVIPSSKTMDVLGDRGLLAAEVAVYNGRNDSLLGADLPPAIAPVNLSQVYIRDQQWILNGRPWENYMQTTRSLQIRGQ